MTINGSRRVSDEIQTVSKNTLIYSLGNLVTKAVSFLLIPLYVRYLTTHDVGIIILFELLELFYNYLAPLGIINAIWRFFNQARVSGEEKMLFSSSYFFTIAFNGMFLLILLAGSDWIAKSYLSDATLTPVTKIYFVALFLGLSRIYYYSFLRIYEKALQFIVIVFLDFVLQVTLTVWFVIGLDLGLFGVIYAKVIVASLIFIFSTCYVLYRYGFRFSLQDCVRSIRFGFPLTFHGVSLLTLTMADRYFIKELISVEMAGIYGIAYKFGMIMNMMIVTPFVQAWQPVLFRLENSPEQKVTYQRMALYFVQVATFLWLVISVGSKYLIRWTTTETYHAGLIIVPWIAFSYLLYGLQNVVNAGALLANATVKLTLYAVVAAGANIILNLLMIREFGMLGAALATVLSYLLLLVLILQLSQKCLYISWRWSKIISVVSLGVAVYGLSTMDLPSVLLNVFKDMFALLLLPLLMLLTGLVRFKELRRFARQFSGR